MMGKVMNNQAIGQPRTETQGIHADSPAHPGDVKKPGKGDGKEFESQLTAAALMAPNAQPQLQPQPLPLAMAMEAAHAAVAAKEALKAQADGAKQPASPALTLKAAASTNTGSVIAGLNQPMSVKDWVFEGETPNMNATSALSRQPAADAQSAQQGPQAARGETDAALASKLDLLALGQMLRSDAGAGAQNPQALQAQAALQQAMQQAHAHAGGDAAAAQDAALEAQLASMGGVVQGLMPQQADGTGAMSASGRTLVPGAKGRLQGGTAQAGLSGGEFLSALGAVKGGMQQSRLEQGSQFQGEQQPWASGQGTTGFGGKSRLHVIPGGAKGGKAEFETELTASQSLGNLAGASATHGNATLATASGAKAEVTGHVTQGANAESRLSSESLAGISSGLRNISAQSTGGEMRIRLKPENLGELHVRVVTDGRNVGLQIQASDEKAKKILEDSLGHLKESMAAQNLSLGAVDLSVAQSHGASFGENHGQQGQSQHGQGMFSDMLGGQGSANQSGNQEWREGRGGAWNGENTGSARVARPAALGSLGGAQAFGPARAAYAANGRLDVRA